MFTAAEAGNIGALLAITDRLERIEKAIESIQSMIQSGDQQPFYAGYVVRDEVSRMFVGPDSDMYRVALRPMAARFTKEGALKYISHNPDGKFLIEDAT